MESEGVRYTLWLIFVKQWHEFKSVLQNRKCIYFERVCQEGIIRTMKEIHGSYYFLRKNISALSFAEFRDFKGFLRETDSLPFGDIGTIYTNKRSQIYIALKRYMKDFARFLCYRGL